MKSNRTIATNLQNHEFLGSNTTVFHIYVEVNWTTTILVTLIRIGFRTKVRLAKCPLVQLAEAGTGTSYVLNARPTARWLSAMLLL